MLSWWVNRSESGGRRALDGRLINREHYCLRPQIDNLKYQRIDGSFKMSYVE